jgi:hypothetical protein
MNSWFSYDFFLFLVLLLDKYTCIGLDCFFCASKAALSVELSNGHTNDGYLFSIVSLDLVPRQNLRDS